MDERPSRRPAKSVLVCAAIQDVLVVGKALDKAESQHRKAELDRMAAMLSRLGGRGYQVRAGTVTCGQCEAEVDRDPDSDLDEKKAQPAAGGDGKPTPQP